MPLYDYRSRDGRRVVTLVRPVDARNLPVMDERGRPMRRVTVPDRVGVVIGKGTPAIDQSRDAINGYHHLECRQGSRFRSEFTAEEIKRAWKDN